MPSDRDVLNEARREALRRRAEQRGLGQTARRRSGYRTNRTIVDDVVSNPRSETPATASPELTTGRMVPNAVYTVNPAVGASNSFAIYTVQRGQLAGKRIIKVQDPNGIGGWRGFAFLTESGHLKLWSRFADDEDLDYVIQAVSLMSYLRDANQDELGSRAYYPSNDTFTLVQRCCYVDNAWHTNQLGFCDTHAPRPVFQDLDSVPTYPFETVTRLESRAAQPEVQEAAATDVPVTVPNLPRSAVNPEEIL